MSGGSCGPDRDAFRDSAERVEPRGIEPRSGGCKPPSWPPRAPSRATAGTRTRSAALATPCASDLTPRSHRERPERGSNPRHRCERPASWPTRRPGRVEHGRKESNPLRRCWRPHGRHVLVRKIELLGRDSNHASFGSEPKILPLDDRGMSCDGWGRTSVVRVTAGCPAIERRRIVSPPAWIRTTTGPGLSRMPLPCWATRG